MKRIFLLFSFLLFFLTAAAAKDKKIAQTGFQFLSVTSDARASGMGEAMTTVQDHSTALFFNPAGMARSQNFLEVNFSQNTWIAGILHNSVSLSFAPMDGRYGVLGFSMQSVDYGEVQGTMVWPNDQGFIDTEVFHPTAFCIGVGYARALSDRFSVGGHIKSAYQYLGKSVVPETDTTFTVDKNTLSTLAYDFGTIYETGWKEFAFGMSVRNFSQEIKYQSEGFQLPLTFRIGASINLLDFDPLHFLALPGTKDPRLLLSVDAIHPRSYAERMNIGLEYNLFDLLYLRYGFLVNYDERSSTVGFGLSKSLGKHFLSIDYAYTPFGIFDSVQKFSIQIAI
ncbi:MAG: DUF3308 domain-containing protein [Candidatus Neomarinimicrobiota bacterium]|nr:MAG: DUF3308 domain-containing protein [Candidatus Neomarinimicrobiota bacterium]